MWPLSPAVCAACLGLSQGWPGTIELSILETSLRPPGQEPGHSQPLIRGARGHPHPQGIGEELKLPSAFLWIALTPLASSTWAAPNATHASKKELFS